MPGWKRLSRVLDSNGGAFGVYGPRGSGKTWAMMRAVDLAGELGGTGLWFPCPSEYAEASEFLSALADNLASVVTAGSGRGAWWRAMTARGRAWRRAARQATALRERIKYTATLRRSATATVSGAYHAAGSLGLFRGRDLTERPTTVASLVFDIRALAVAIVAATSRHLVIAIDELDKLGDPEQAKKLLRDIKGIFDVPGVVFLVSVSEEAAATLQLGALQGTGRNEFNSSFATVIEMPPLDPGHIGLITQARGWLVPHDLPGLLCLLSAGNLREFVRLADLWEPGPRHHDDRLGPADRDRARDILKGEAATLWREVVRVCGPTAGQVLPRAWAALPDEDFADPDKFDTLSRAAIHDHWTLNQQDQSWEEKVADRWRRFLIRLFVVGQAISPSQRAREALASDNAICDLRDVLIMAGHSTEVALLMLKARFGDDLSSPYAVPPGRDGILRACHFRYRAVVLADGVAKGGCSVHASQRGSRCEYSGGRPGQPVEYFP